MIIRFLVIVTVYLVTLSDAKEECYAHNENPYLNFSSKTAYEFIYNKDGIPPLTGCKAVRVWMLCRHGTRWPGRKQYPGFYSLSDIRDRVIANYKAGRGSLCADDLANLQRFEFSAPISAANLLTEQGRKDMSNLGRRLSDRFPKLFQAPYSPDKHVLLHDESVRTRESAVAFAEGAFRINLDSTLPDTNTSIIRLIHPYKKCLGWKEAEGEAKTKEKAFDGSQLMLDTIDRVSAKLGFDDTPLKLEEVIAIYEGCRYQKAWQLDETSPWCTAFTEEELKVLEYRKDMSEYYRSGPASKTSLRLACPLVKDLLDRFRSADGPSALLYFSHDNMMRMLLSRLGLVTDNPPPSPENMADQTRRKWRISLMAPFAANLIAVLYNCSDSGADGILSVAFYLQERPIALPGCGGRTLCDLRELETIFGGVAYDPVCTDLSFCRFDGDNSDEPLYKTASMKYALLFILVASFLHFWIFRNR